jgi:LPXTG-site transpeptidase (sortase) family protein
VYGGIIMFESRYSKILTVILVVIIIAIIALLGVLGYQWFKDSSIESDAEAFVNENEGKITKVKSDSDDSGDFTEIESDLENADTGSSSSGSTKLYKGYVTTGSINIPKTNCTYPILEELSNQSLDTAVVQLYGVGLNQVGNTVIIGHNYRNGLFFSNNKKLTNGDIIYITDNDGNKMTYTIYNIFETTPEDTSFYQRDTNGKAEITLSTCTDDSSARLIIFARAE